MHGRSAGPEASCAWFAAALTDCSLLGSIPVKYMDAGPATMVRTVSDLFIGIVTHPSSRHFAEVTDPAFAEGFLTAASGAGLRAEVRINERNAFDESGTVLSSATVIRAAWFQARLEADWHRYLTGSGVAALLVRRVGILALRLREYLRPVQGRGSRILSGDRLCRRLANIELSHLDLLRQAVESGAAWILILEDDGHAQDLDDLMRDVRAIIEAAGSCGSPQYVSLSESFDVAHLGVHGLMEPAQIPGVSRVVLRARRPVTNTVCAMLYRADFAADVLRYCDEMGLFPVCAIDWKLNAVLMDMHAAGQLVDGDCWFIEPGPFRQRSMHAM